MVPPRWARGGHAQTLAGHFLRGAGADLATWDGARRVEIPVSKGDRLVGFHVPGESGVLVYLFHGLSGDTRADCVQRAARLARERGHAILAVNHRGCGAGAGLARQPYHSGVADDLACAIALGRELAPRALHVAVGFSLSGNVLLLLLARGGQAMPDAAICVNPPIDLARCARRLAEGWNRLYDLRFVTRLRRSIEERRAAGHFDVECYRVPRFATLRTFDELYTAPSAGFVNADDYYARCSAAPELPLIDRPTVLLTAADDPFIDVDVFHAARRSKAVHLHVEDTGGHLGYLSGEPTPRGDRFWLDYAIGHYLDQLTA